jgi:phenylpropionate dioxygenase-like ring-hydroxylating dioxygenase large terminal subunit
MANLITARGDRTLRSLIDGERGTVSRELYVNEDIFAQEMEMIYGRCWLFLGHESQAPNPGDFFVSRMGTEEVLVVRDRKDKKLRAFLNSCAHRGMKVCRYDQGNALVFTCPFHAWTYDTAGKLAGAAYQFADNSYAGALDRDKEQWGLVEVAQFKNYYGSLWATWDAKAPSFEDYVGPFAEGIRYDCEASDGTDAGIEVFTPFQKWRLPSNWKVPAFSSSTDLTHAAMTHRSVNAAAIGPDRGTMTGGERHKRRADFPSDRYAVGDHYLGHGGNWTDFKQTGAPDYVDSWFEAGVDDYFRETQERKKKKYAGQILPPHGHEGGHFCVFPNFIMDSWRWRWWHPHTVGVVERWSLFGVDKAAPKHVKDAVRHYVMRYNGPTGATESDDMENWNYVQAASMGSQARKHDYYFANGLGNGSERGQHPGLVFNGSHTEEAHRARFSRWLAFMEAGSWDELYPVNKSAGERIW